MTTFDFNIFKVDIYVDVYNPNLVIEDYIDDSYISSKIFFLINIDNNGKPKLVYTIPYFDEPPEDIPSDISYVKYLIVVDFLYGDYEDFEIMHKPRYPPYNNIAIDYTVNTDNITPEIMNMFRDLDYENIYVLIDRYRVDEDYDIVESDTVVGNVNRYSVIRDIKNIMTQLSTINYSHPTHGYIVLAIIGIGYD
jgi:hypothetical protein